MTLTRIEVVFLTWISAALVVLAVACGLPVATGDGGSTSPVTDSEPTDASTPTEASVASGEPGTGTSTSAASTGDAGSTGGATTAATTGGDRCGDGLVDADEGCDDAEDNSPYAACTDECQVNVCGDGKVHTGVEGCDEGPANIDTDACRSDCQPNVCGDGAWYIDVEECDAGPENGPEFGQCDEACTINRCGDGELDVGHEVCDDGDEANGSGRPGEDGKTGCDVECGFSGRRLFLSSKTFDGDMSTRAGADLACQNMAAAVQFKHPEDFRALLADAQGSPNTFLAEDPDGRPFILPSGLIVAATYAALIAQGPGAGITTTETGEVLVEKLVWTNINPFGDAYLVDPEHTCTGWTSADATQSARVGLNAVEPGDLDGLATWKSGRQWFGYATMPCSGKRRIYCVEAQ
jgi:hypothetical protein